MLPSLGKNDRKASDQTYLTPQFDYSKIFKYFEMKITNRNADEVNMKSWI